MSLSFDNPEYPSAAPPGTDTLADSVLMLLALTVVQRLVGFGRAVLFCRWLPAEQLGLWDMTFSFLLVAAPLAVLAIPGVFGRYLEYYRQRGQLRAFLRRALLACATLATAACLAIVLGRRSVSSLLFGTADRADLVALSAGCLATVIAYNFLIELFTAMRNIRLVSAIQLTNSVAFAALGVSLLLCWQPSARSVLLSYGGSCLVAAAVGGYYVLRARNTMLRTRNSRGLTAPEVCPKGAFSLRGLLAPGYCDDDGDGDVPLPHAALWPKVIPFAAWLLLANVLMNLFEVVDRYMIIHFSGRTAGNALDVVGNYHASRLVPMLLVSVAAMLAAMITPHLSHDWESGRRALAAARLRLFLKLVGLGLWALAVAVIVAAPLLFDVALRGKYPGGQAVLPWTLVYCTWFGLWVIAQNYLLCAEKARLSSLSLLCGLVLNVALNLALLPRLGLEGAVLATAAANALSLWLLCRFNRRLGFRLDEGARLVLVLPLTVCLGPWISTLALLAVAAELLWGHRLLLPEEKERLAQGIVEYGKRFGLTRLIAKPGRV